jgi:NAD(P)-dependent dehydrogenase (short-subunit alcohol dehydrogenase family)
MANSKDVVVTGVSTGIGWGATKVLISKGFAPVRINETLTLDFDNRDRFEMHHYAFHVSDAESTRSSVESRRTESPTAAVHSRKMT